MNPKTILAADRLADIQCSRIYVSDKAEMHREAGYSYKLPRGEDIMPITLGGTTYRAALTLTQHLLSSLQLECSRRKLRDAFPPLAALPKHGDRDLNLQIL